MVDSYFVVLDESEFSGRYGSNPATSGPWDPGLQHGGPPSALSVRAAERAAREATERSDLVAVRFSAEFVGPVPVAEVEIHSEVVRQARSAVLVATRLTAAGRTCLEARTWLVRAADTGSIAHPGTRREPPGDLPGIGGEFPFARSIEWRSEYGRLDTPGPGRVWARPRINLVGEQAPRGLQRVALVGDSASGISSELDWATWSFLNVDLDVHLARPVHGDWLLLDARTQLGDQGSALTRSTVSDMAGQLGSTLQTLVLAPRG